MEEAKIKAKATWAPPSKFIFFTYQKNDVVSIAAKPAIVGSTKTAAAEYGKQGISVNALCPGFIMTDLHARVLKGS